MARAVPPVPRRNGNFPREWLDFFEALRNAVGGDSADVSVDIDLSSLSTIPVPAAQESPQELTPAGVFETAPVGSD